MAHGDLQISGKGNIRSTLLDELIVLENLCAQTFITLAEVSSLEDDELPYILKASSRQSSTLQMLHSCRLMLVSEQAEKLHHAIKIIALVAAGLDEPSGQQLIKASNLRRSILVKYRSFVFGELSRIQTRTGWKTETRKNRLLQVWDLDD
ncbi:protein of unknown function [Taphrina deformans PYCC 5710]|uniref:Uncharacterized protein n=1 Tax=Taphrina deformans (strain PYCC 5710 / ATCC 11124 / CBS 356.35 / IMI 108563 / JCM 9778 / NBRC 8474) TaxID=1097556 RepID=R4XG24_TAPDE|nr:protein of unknown function [Taphrina deformans PYCC 5710]|eukprot:CCG83449.1 protein of unknown function [Taphrina deformans PYCC 5710]